MTIREVLRGELESSPGLTGSRSTHPHFNDLSSCAMMMP
jgi:hypothetical protein